MTAVLARRESAAERGVPALELAEWRAAHGVVAGITRRDGDFNLGLTTDAPTGRVVTAWRGFLAAFRPSFPGAVVGFQVHDRDIAVHRSPVDGWLLVDGYDGHATTHPGLLLCVTVADCVPVYLLHPPSGAMALVHAGWRGVAAGVLDAGLTALTTLTGAAWSDVVIHCGTAICGKCYEVGPEVLAAVEGVAAEGAGQLDLRGNLVKRAREAGVREVSVSPYCSAHDADVFFSHRRSGGTDGRMVAYLGRPLD